MGLFFTYMDRGFKFVITYTRGSKGGKQTLARSANEFAVYLFVSESSEVRIHYFVDSNFPPHLCLIVGQGFGLW